MNRPKILVTGFGPFPGMPKNPSAAVALSLARSKRVARHARVSATIIPTIYAEIALLLRLIEREKPDVLLMLGVAGRTSALRIETCGRNRASLFHADAARKKPPRTLISGAPGVLAIRAPVRQMLQAARNAGAPTRLSRNAGGYICNAAIFHALHATHLQKSPLVAFVHIPPASGRRKILESPRTQPTMVTIKRAAEAILIVLAQSVNATT